MSDSPSPPQVSLRPSVASFKPGTKLRPSPKSSPPQDHTPAAKSSPSSVHTPAPRTRDDSSDEDDHRRPSGGYFGVIRWVLWGDQVGTVGDQVGTVGDQVGTLG